MGLLDAFHPLNYAKSVNQSSEKGPTLKINGHGALASVFCYCAGRLIDGSQLATGQQDASVTYCLHRLVSSECVLVCLV